MRVTCSILWAIKSHSSTILEGKCQDPEWALPCLIHLQHAPDCPSLQIRQEHDHYPDLIQIDQYRRLLTLSSSLPINSVAVTCSPAWWHFEVVDWGQVREAAHRRLNMLSDFLEDSDCIWVMWKVISRWGWQEVSEDDNVMMNLPNVDDTILIKELRWIRELSSGDLRPQHGAQSKIVYEMGDPEWCYPLMELITSHRHLQKPILARY